MAGSPPSRYHAQPLMQYRTLGRTGLRVSILGYGASSLGDVFYPTDDANKIRTVRTALDLGINFIDVSPYYGATRAEAVLGRALREVDRERYILATKVGQYGEDDFDFSASRVERSLDESCRRLGVDFIDLLQCHDIEFADLDQIVNETLPAMQRLKERGRIGHIGITGLPLKIFPAVIERSDLVEAILSFCHYTLNDRTLEPLIPYFAKRNIGVINAAPTGMGLYTERGAPPWHPAPPRLQTACRSVVEYCRGLGEDAVKLAIQFSVAHPGIATTVVGTAEPEFIRKDVAYALTPPDPELMGRVLARLDAVRDVILTRGRPENRDPEPISSRG